MIGNACIILLAFAASVVPAYPASRFITLASTTSTEQSGLFAHLLPLFTARTGIEVRVVAQGTGQALRTAARGDADVVLVHDPSAEEKFVADGFGVERHDLMYNDFVLLGPASDPAGVAATKTLIAALRKIAERQVLFVSRGDDSGTHRAELRQWNKAGIDPKSVAGSWYRETGSGMGPTLNMAVELEAYVLSDRATWANFANRSGHAILLAGDPALRNSYGVILVNPKKHPHVKAKDAQAFIDWLLSTEGRAAIAAYKVNGEQVFFPGAAGDPS
jgi:tungstate transport system substrate-binding protein